MAYMLELFSSCLTEGSMFFSSSFFSNCAKMSGQGAFTHLLTGSIVGKELFSGLADAAELAAAERSLSLSRCSRCRMAGGGLSSRLHFTSCRIQAEHGRFSSHYMFIKKMDFIY